MEFTKMQGAGNDYIYIDCIHSPAPEDPAALAVAMSRYHYGIGSDGLILVLPSSVADCRMRMFNNDGSEAQMCGNGIRCFAKFVHDRGIISKKAMTVETKCGLRRVEIIAQEGNTSICTVAMGKPRFAAADIPAAIEGVPVPIIDYPIEACGGEYRLSLVSMGNPHAVCIVPRVEGLDIERIGSSIEKNPLFPERVNVEFVEVLDFSRLRMRVWERGSGVTLACGTGACASLVVTALKGLTGRTADVELDGGALRIAWDAEDIIHMTGSAVEVFTGEYDVRGGSTHGKN